MRRFRTSAFALSAVLALLAPAGAHASSTQDSLFQDDGLLQTSGPEVRERTLDQLDTMGVDTVRVLLVWARVAPDAGSDAKPSFDGADPAAYPPTNWDIYDAIVRGARARGMNVLLNVTSPVPHWASRCRTDKDSCNPNPTEYGAFVNAAARRYSGSYADENEGGAALPRVSRWSFINEPNVRQWLSPQFVRRGSLRVPFSPRMYRELALRGIAALRAQGHARDTIMIADTAPFGLTSGGTTARNMAPGLFLRELFCLNSRGGNLGGRLGRTHGCPTRFPRLNATAIAHHPYVRGGSKNPLFPVRRDEITLRSASRLKTIFGWAARRGRVPGGLPIHYTEFGFQTNPPDRFLGVSLTAQARYLNQSEYLTFRDARVRGMAQYLLRDDANSDGFQSGLAFASGRSKPGLAAYRLPMWLIGSGSSVTVFGQVRPGRNGQRQRVEIQNRGSRSGTFRTVSRVNTTNRKGFFMVRLRRRSGDWRLRWQPAGGGSALVSRTAEVGR